MPYVLARPALRQALAEREPSDDERKIVENVTKRVRLWNEVGPYYTDEGYGNGKPAESRGTEAVLNALILASNDAQGGKLSDDTRTAFNNMWALQLTEGDEKGAWSWLQFGMKPWEASDSPYYGAASAALAVGIAPEDYRSDPKIQNQIGMLRDYLNRESAAQSPINRAVLLWSSTKLPGLLDPARQRAIITELLDQQQPDGGWRLASLGWPEGWSLHSLVRTRLRSDGTSQDRGSDGYATGLIVFVLEQAGTPADDPHLKRGLAWLEGNQSENDGSWPSMSLNKARNPSSNVGSFMRDAATAYAVLALHDGQPDSQKLSHSVAPASGRK